MPGWLIELQAWWAQLPREWVFLLALPFLVGLVGWLVDHASCGGRGSR